MKEKLSLSQEQALIKLKEFRKSDKKEFVLSGAGGTGKTYLLRKLFERRKPGKKKETFVPSTILGIAVTHQAVLNLSKYIPNSKTYASAVDLKMEFDFNGNIYFIPRHGKLYYNEIRKYKEIVIDECSQFSEEMMLIISKSIREDAKVYYVGDEKQLPPIGITNDKDSPTFNIKDKFILTDKIRQKEGEYIPELCDYVRERIDTDNDLSFIKNLKRKYNAKTKKGYSISNEKSVIQSYVKNFKEGNDVRITAYRNKRIEHLNFLVREKLWGDSSEDKYVVGEFIIMNEQYAPNGIPIAFNGQTFKVKKITTEMVNFVECYILDVGKSTLLAVPTDEGIKVYNKEASRLKFEALKKKDWYDYMQFISKYANISYGYAINNYKIQGATIKGCYVDLTDILSVKPLSNKRKLQAFYVGISRPTHTLAIF